MIKNVLLNLLDRSRGHSVRDKREWKKSSFVVSPIHEVARIRQLFDRSNLVGQSRAARIRHVVQLDSLQSRQGSRGVASTAPPREEHNEIPPQFASGPMFPCDNSSATYTGCTDKIRNTFDVCFYLVRQRLF